MFFYISKCFGISQLFVYISKHFVDSQLFVYISKRFGIIQLFVYISKRFGISQLFVYISKRFGINFIIISPLNLIWKPGHFAENRESYDHELVNSWSKIRQIIEVLRIWWTFLNLGGFSDITTQLSQLDAHSRNKRILLNFLSRQNA